MGNRRSQGSTSFPRFAIALPLLAAALLGACTDRRGPPPSSVRVPLAVLGDSDSHAYQDRLSFPEDDPARGGAHRTTSLQWTEVLVRLRVSEIDPGAWGEWGFRGRWAALAEAFGQPRRTPRKQDFEFNYAWSGARCVDLVEGSGRQAPRLAARMRDQRDAWSRGVVVIRVGINDLGTSEALEAFARDGDSDDNRRIVDACLGFIERAVRQIADVQPKARVLLVGVLDNVDWPRNAGRFTDAGERQRIAAVLDRFDEDLRAIADAAPNIAFFDDRAFYRALVGQRALDGRPSYRAVPVRDAAGAIAFEAAIAEGDAMTQLYLADGHAGTVLNAHWAQAFAESLRREFGLPVTPISDAERDAFLMELRAASTAR